MHGHREPNIALKTYQALSSGFGFRAHSEAVALRRHPKDLQRLVCNHLPQRVA
jgi:hypothetical protein